MMMMYSKKNDRGPDFVHRHIIGAVKGMQIKQALMIWVEHGESVGKPLPLVIANGITGTGHPRL